VKSLFRLETWVELRLIQAPDLGWLALDKGGKTVELKFSLPAVLTAVRLLSPNPEAVVVTTLRLTAEERGKSRHRFIAEDGTLVYLNLPRGTVLRSHALLATDANQLVRVVAKPQAVVVVTAESSLALMRAAYHLGNRHVPLEVSSDALKLEPDPVLEEMLTQLGGLSFTTTTLPFEPETGAYRTPHPHRHAHL
jgi:urease accessory protein